MKCSKVRINIEIYAFYFLILLPVVLIKEAKASLYIYIYIYIYMFGLASLLRTTGYIFIYTILPKVLGHPLLMDRFDYLSNFQVYKS